MPVETEEIAAARAKIAAITPAQPGGEYIQPGQVISFRPENAVSAQTIPEPVSPAAEVVAQEKPAILEQLPQVMPGVQAGMGAVKAKTTAAKASVKQRKDNLPSPVRPILSAVGTFILLFALFHAQIIFSQLKYLTAKPQAATSAITAQTAVISPDPTITIPKINVNAPVVYQPSIAEADVLRSLQDGVVHYGTSVVPGQNGNMVIVGHSSNDWWEAGNYKFVFVLLDKLAVGDQFSINYQSKRYVYQVTNIKIVQPTDLSVLAPTTTPTATLITCTPPGTSWKRLVVVANQVSPAPGQPSAIPAGGVTSQTAVLPGNAPSFTSELSRGWQNIVTGVESIFGHSTQAPQPAATPTTTQPTSSSNSSSGGTLPSGL